MDGDHFPLRKEFDMITPRDKQNLLYQSYGLSTVDVIPQQTSDAQV